MISVKDRIPLYPGRVNLNPVAGQTNKYDMTRADDPTEAGTPINRETFRLLQGDIRTYPVKAGQTIRAWDVVDVDESGVYRSVTGNKNVNTVFNGGNTSNNSVAMLTEETGVLCYVSGSGNSAYAQARVIKVGATGIDASSSSVFVGGSALIASEVKCARLSDTRFAVSWCAGESLFSSVGVVNGTAISWGTRVTTSVGTTNYATVVPVSDTSFLAVYNRGGIKSRMCSVSATGTAITQGTEYALAGSTNAAYISVTHLPDLGGNKRVCVCFADRSDGNKGKMLIATISSTNVVTWGAVATFRNGATSFISCCYDGECVVISYSECANVNTTAGPIAVKAISISEVGITGQGSSFVVYDANMTTKSLTKAETKVVLAYDQSTCVLKRSGLAFSWGEAFRFNTGNAYNIETGSVSDTRIAIFYADVANSNYGTATILEVQGDQIAGSFTNMSKDAIALQDAASGQPCEVIFDGVAELPGITAGTGINSDGVHGYAPEDGRIWVRPGWDAPYVTGRYTGTGRASSSGNKRSLDFGFVPSLVAIRVVEHPSNINPYFAILIPAKSGFGYGASFLIAASGDSACYSIVVIPTQTGIEWYGGDSVRGMDYPNTTYEYVAYS